MGRVTVPVYEIYKAGDDPYWLPGLDVLGTMGINAAIIPHYDNREGGDHDTRFCFLGEKRLLSLEEQLPPGTFILGIDEHSALMLDLVAELGFVHGRGGVTIRRNGLSQTIPAGETIALAELRATVPRADAPQAPPSSQQAEAPSPADGAAVAERLVASERELAIARERAGMVEPLISALLEIRRAARESGDFDTADALRDRLMELGVEVSDSADGSDYRFAERKT
jgi:hypothetical protein